MRGLSLVCRRFNALIHDEHVLASLSKDFKNKIDLQDESIQKLIRSLNGPLVLKKGSVIKVLSLLRLNPKIIGDLEKKELLGYFVECGYTKIPYLLIKEFGVSANQENSNGFYPIIRATQKGYLATLRVLLENGADANTTTVTGLTPLKCAVEWRNENKKELVEALLKRGASTKKTYGGKETIFDIARKKAGHEIIDLLRQYQHQ